MRIIIYIMFYVSAFCIIWPMWGYGFSLKFFNKIGIAKKAIKTDKKPYVTVMIVAHNEEKIIEKKLENVIDNNYPKNKIKYIIASDKSSDLTNVIVNDFIRKHRDLNIILYTSKEHKGKTNVQNEAQELVDSEILIMTDANSMFENDAISELVSSFSEKNIAYVCGALIYKKVDNIISIAESRYWDNELKMRLVESNIKTITAGNGAIYACRNSEYIKIQPIECHDIMWPYIYAKKGKRAIFNEKAIAYEKTGETIEDEYKRKVRMNRGIFNNIYDGLKILNIFKYGWFSYFYFGHRTTRYLLWINHLLVFVINIYFVIINENFWIYILLLQIMFYVLGIIGKFVKNKYIHMVYYYCVTIIAQWHGVINVIVGRTKSTWESIDSTR